MTYLYVFIGGGLGSVARYFTSKISLQLFTTDFPVGTIISNILACGLLAILALSFQSRQTEYEWIQPLLIIGFCGGYSTFSAFSNETFMLMDSGQSLFAILNILISVGVGIGLIFLIRSKA